MDDTVVHDLYTKGVFFLSDNSDYSFASVCLADGLHQLGIPVSSNISYCEQIGRAHV